MRCVLKVGCACRLLPDSFPPPVANGLSLLRSSARRQRTGSPEPVSRHPRPGAPRAQSQPDSSDDRQAKNQHHRGGRPAPHITPTASGIIVPSWARGPQGKLARDGASRAFSHIRCNTRRFEVRMATTRSRAQTARCKKLRWRTWWTRPTRRRWSGWHAMLIDVGAGHPPDPDNCGDAVGLAAARQRRAAHDRDVRRAKGRPATSSAIVASRSARTRSISPSRALRHSLFNCSPAGQECVAPANQCRHRDAERARVRLQVFPAQPPQERVPLALARHPPAATGCLYATSYARSRAGPGYSRGAKASAASTARPRRAGVRWPAGHLQKR